MIQKNWKRSFFTIWAGQAVALITSSVLQMAIIWYLTDTTGSAMVLSMATMVGFLPQAILGTMIGVLVDHWNRKLVGAEPRGFTTTFQKFEMKPDGIWQYIMHGPDGVDYPNTNVIVEVVKPERIVINHAVFPIFWRQLSLRI